MNKYTAIVLAAGLGKRMNSDLPKVLHTLQGKALVNHVLTQLSMVKAVDQVVVVVGYKAQLVQQQVKKQYPHAEFALQKQLLGTADAVKSALPKVKNSKVLILCGDAPLLTKQTIEDFISQYEADKDVCSVLTAVVSGKNQLGVIERDDQGLIKGIKEKIEIVYSKMVNEVNSGMYAVEVNVLKEALKKIAKNPKKGEYFLTDIIGILYNQGQKVGSYVAQDEKEVLGINTCQELLAADKILRGRIIDSFISKGVIILDPETTFIDAQVKIGRQTVIYPFSFIEGEVTIGQNCLIGPFIRIRKGSVIKDKAVVGNFVEVNRSTIGKDARAKHFCYLGDTVVGDKANIGAGTVVANYDGKNKHKTNIGQAAFIGCDSVLVAPVNVGDNSVTGAGSVVTKNVKSGDIVVGVPARFLKRKVK